MRHFQSLLLIFTVCFTIAEVFEHNKSVKITFLNLQVEDVSDCWSNENIISKKVIFKDDYISLNDYFKVTEALTQWPINIVNVVDMMYLMKTILSCEFSEILSHIIESLKTQLLLCQDTYKTEMVNETLSTLNVFQTCVGAVFLKLSHISKTEISKILITLTEYLKFRNNFVSNKQDILSILLTWYLHRDFFNADISSFDYITITNHIETFNVIWGQIQFAFKGFIIQNCQREQDFNNITALSYEEIKKKLNNCIPQEKAKSVNSPVIPQKNVEETPNSSYEEDSNYDSEMEQEEEPPPKKKSLTPVRQPEIKSKMIFNFESHRRLLQIIKLNMTIQIRWNNSQWLSIDDIFYKHIVNSKQLLTVLRYEQIMVFILSKLMYGWVVSEIRPMLVQDYDERKCQLLSDEFNDFVSSEQMQNLPAVFVSDMKEIQLRIISIFHYLRNINTIEQAKAKFKEMESKDKVSFNKKWLLLNRPSSIQSGDINLGKPAEISELKRFLSEFILVQIKNTYLNSDIIDILNDTSYITMFGPFEYAFNLEIVHSSRKIAPNESRNQLCKNIEMARNEAAISINLIRNCSDVVKSCTHLENSPKILKESVNYAFENYNKSVVSLRTKVINTFLDAYRNQKDVDIGFNLGKLLLTFIYNLENVDLFNVNTQEYINEVRIENLKTFQSNFQNIILKCHLLMCDKPSVPIKYDSTSSDSLENNTNLNDYISKKYTIKNNVLTGTKIEHSDDGPGKCFDVIKRYTKFISDVYKEFYGRQIRLYWNGTEKSIYDIKTEMNENTFDLQDVIEFQYRTIKWIISVVYSVYLNILNGLTYYNLKPKDVPSECFVQQFVYLSSISFHSFTSRPIRYIIETFKDIITLDGTVQDSKNLRSLILQELKMLEVEVVSLPNVTDDDLKIYVNRVCQNTEALQKANFSGLIQTMGLKHILVDQPELPSVSRVDFKITEIISI